MRYLSLSGLTRSMGVIAVLILLGGCRPAPRISGVGPVQVGPFAVVLAWTSDRPARFRIRYGEGSSLDGEIRESAASAEHRVMISGLKPSTRYSYLLDPGGNFGTFRTAPGSEGSFALAIASPSASAIRPDRSDPALEPDLLVITGETASGWRPPLPAVLTVPLTRAEPQILSYGPWQVAVAADPQLGLVALKALELPLDQVILVLPLLPESISEELVGTVIASPAGIRYRGKFYPGDDTGLLRLEVDAFEVSLLHFRVDRLHRQVVVEAPPETKKTCLYCDRLLEQERYQESLDWYRKFVRENREDYAVEEAMFTIARILDEKLFEYHRAREAYREFESEYPHSRRLPLVKNRLSYLQEYSDFEYRPLREFERVKASLPLAGFRESAEKIALLLEEYPGAKIREEVLAWVARLLEIESPREAERYFLRLIDEFPDSENARIAAIARGDIRYRGGRYGEAAGIYRQALRTVSDRYRISLREKIHRSLRNRHREIYRWLAVAVLIFWLAATFFRCRRLSVRGWAVPVLFLLTAAASGGIYFILTWERSREIFPVTAVLTIALAGVMIWNRIWGGAKKSSGYWIVGLHMLSASLAAVYLILYHFHFLYLFGI